MTAEAAGVFRRSEIERTDQRVSWERSHQAFFGSGACHVLAWICREVHVGRPIQIAAMSFADDARAFHVYARWDRWAFDHSGWNHERDLLEVNADFEGRAIHHFDVFDTLSEFCRRHTYRLAEEFWSDPTPRARAFIADHAAPWV